jgi:hypothetical protein
MKYVGLTLACLLLLTPFMLHSASAEPALNIEWQRNSGFDLHSGINGQWTITAHPSSNRTAYVEFYLDSKLQTNSTQTPYSWTFNTDNYPEGEHTIRVTAYTSTGETASATDTRIFTGFPYMFIVGVLLFGSIVFAFSLLLTYYLIKQKANAKRTAGKISSTTRHSIKR